MRQRVFSAWGIHAGPFAALEAYLVLEYFQLLYWEVQFLLPQRSNNEKREFTQLKNWMRQRVFSAWAIHSGPFAAL